MQIYLQPLFSLGPFLRLPTKRALLVFCVLVFFLLFEEDAQADPKQVSVQHIFSAWILPSLSRFIDEGNQKHQRWADYPGNY